MLIYPLVTQLVIRWRRCNVGKLYAEDSYVVKSAMFNAECFARERIRKEISFGPFRVFSGQNYFSLADLRRIDWLVFNVGGFHLNIRLCKIFIGKDNANIFSRFACLFSDFKLRVRNSFRRKNAKSARLVFEYSFGK